MGKEFIFPDLGEGITEGELVKWLVKEGDRVEEDQDVAEVETDKALVTIPSPMAGLVEKLCFQEGDRIPVGKALLIFKEEGETSAAPPEKTEAKAPPAPPPEKTEAKAPPSPTTKTPSVAPMEPKKVGLPPLATPHTRKLARELGVDLKEVKGTGKDGRILDEDVQAFAGRTQTGTAPTPLPVTPAPTVSAAPGVDFAKFGPVEKIPLKGIRRKISQTMMVAHQQAVMVTHVDEAEVGALLKIKKEKSHLAKERKVKLTLLPFLMKACVIALKDYPYLNASLVGEEIILKKYYHFGFAVDTEAGLMVPVIRNVDKKSILHLATELMTLSEQTRDRTVTLENLQGSTFSLTNIGSIGGKFFTPILNYPDSAILGIGKSYEKPIVLEGELVPAAVMPLCLTFDHRVADGATAARFVNRIIKLLKDPDLLLLEDGED